VSTVDVLLTGNYYCDLIFTGMSELPTLGSEIYAKGMELVPGGGAINTMIGLRNLGVTTGWVGVFGTDFASRLISEWLTEQGIDLSLVLQRNEPFRRITVAMSYPQDRAFLTYNDPRVDTIPQLQAAVDRVSPRLIHFPGLSLDARLPTLFADWRARGIQIAMDCQHRPHTINSPLVRETLSQIDIFLPNASEALRLTERTTLEEAACTLRDLVPRLVVKDGANGAWLWDNVGKYHVPAIPITPLDTTGAGDAFNAGYLAAHLAGCDGIGCLRQGNVCGGLSTLGYGGALSAPHRDAVTAALAQYETQASGE